VTSRLLEIARKLMIHSGGNVQGTLRNGFAAGCEAAALHRRTSRLLITGAMPLGDRGGRSPIIRGQLKGRAKPLPHIGRQSRDPDMSRHPTKMFHTR
jgi:hypothetical protein